MLRAILALLFAILYLIIGIPVLFVEWIIGKFNRQAADISQLRMVQWAFRVILFICGTKLTIIGEKCSKRPACSLYWQSQELFRYHHHLLTLSAPDRLCSKRFHEKGSSFYLSGMTRLHCLFINRSDVKEALKRSLQESTISKTGFRCVFSLREHAIRQRT